MCRSVSLYKSIRRKPFEGDLRAKLAADALFYPIRLVGLGVAISLFAEREGGRPKQALPGGG
jgi:hypothetical protein